MDSTKYVRSVVESWSYEQQPKAQMQVNSSMAAQTIRNADIPEIKTKKQITE